jgi:hypothetical protein
MFRRAFWFTTGAAAGVWATTKVQRKIRALAPDALALRAADKAVEGGHRLKHFALDVRAGMSQRETELREALGISAAPPEPEHAPLPGRPRRGELGAAPTSPTHVHDHDRNEDH